MPRHIEELVNEHILRAEMAKQSAVDTGLSAARPVVTISRSMGSGARIIAQKLAQDLGLSLWDRELLDEMANNASVSRKVVEAFDEKSMSEIELLMRDLLGNHELSSFIYARHLITAVAGIGRLGNAVILGRGSNFILPHALNIRIDAPEHLRVQNMMTYEQLTEAESIAKIRRSDRERRAFLIKTFGKDTVGHCIYNLSFCMCAFSNDDAAEIIKTAIQRRFNSAA